MISIRDADQCSSGVALSRRVPKLIGLGVFLRPALFRSVVKQNMGPKAQIASVIGVALAFGLFIQCVTFALDQSFVAKRTTEFQESQLAAVDQVAQRVRWQFQKL